jgi:hypothetical protein
MFEEKENAAADGGTGSKTTAMQDLLDRIVINPEIYGGKPITAVIDSRSNMY